MKTRFNCFVICSILMWAYAFAEPAWAASIVGKVTSLGTQTPRTFQDRTEARFEVRVKATCDGSDETDRVILVRQQSFFSSPSTTDDSANFRNAYSTLLAALLAGNSVGVDGSGVSCDVSQDVLFRQIRIRILAQ
jgi:hypothetical protein